MQKPAFHETLDEVVALDQRYTHEAYGFLREALEFTPKRRRKSRAASTTHVSASDLLQGFREYSVQQFGPMSMTVLDYWGIRSTSDIGHMVFNLIKAGVFGRAENDHPEDFENGFSFQEAFVAPFQPAEKASTRQKSGKPKLAQKTK